MHLEEEDLFSLAVHFGVLANIHGQRVVRVARQISVQDINNLVRIYTLKFSNPNDIIGEDSPFTIIIRGGHEDLIPFLLNKIFLIFTIISVTSSFLVPLRQVNSEEKVISVGD
jgi:hypothetical protein